MAKNAREKAAGKAWAEVLVNDACLEAELGPKLNAFALGNKSGHLGPYRETKMITFHMAPQVR